MAEPLIAALFLVAVPAFILLVATRAQPGRVERDLRQVAASNGWWYRRVSHWLHVSHVEVVVPHADGQILIRTWPDRSDHFTSVSFDGGYPGFLEVMERPGLPLDGNVHTADEEYDARFHISSTEPQRLRAVLDAEFRRLHLAHPVHLDLSLGVLSVRIPSYGRSAAELEAILELFVALRRRMDRVYGRRQTPELQAAPPDTYCATCGASVPALDDVTDADKQRVCELVLRERPEEALRVLREVSRCSEETAERFLRHCGHG